MRDFSQTLARRHRVIKLHGVRQASSENAAWRRLLAVLMALAVLGCVDKRTAVNGVLHPLPQGVEERGLAAGEVSRMGFAAAPGRTVRLSVAVPRSASRMVLAHGVPDRSGESIVCRASVRGPGERWEPVFEQAAEPGSWHEGNIPMEPYRGADVEVQLSSEAAAGHTDVYWATPIVLCSSGERPNVLLISIDSLRADHVGCYGYGRNTTPTLDSLAAIGTVFTNAVAQSSWTLPSHVSLLTGMYSKTHGVSTVREGLGVDAVTLAERMRSAGYTTAAFVSGHLMLPLYGMDQGFDLYDASCVHTTPEERHTDITSPCLQERVSKWLSDCGDAPFFLFVHYWDVHFDYAPPVPFDTLFDPGYRGQLDGSDFAHNENISPDMPPRDLEHLVALYDGEVAYTDMHIGMLMHELRSHGLDNRTLVVVTSDHGDEFFEHGGKGHGHTLFQELIRVPLIWVEPGRTGAVPTVEDVVELVDVAPSVLKYVGLGSGALGEGRSLGSFLSDRPDGPGVAFSEVRRGDYLKAVVSRDAKLVESVEAGTTVLYDLRNDPGEQVALSPGELPQGTTLAGALRTFVEAGSATLELRVVGIPRTVTLSLVFSEMPLELVPQGLESNDELTFFRDRSSALLRVSAPAGDSDGVSIMLLSPNTVVKINGMVGDHLLRGSDVILGADARPRELPVHVRVGDKLLWMSGPEALSAAEKRGVHVWTSDTVAVNAGSVELGAELGERLKALGYIE